MSLAIILIDEGTDDEAIAEFVSKLKPGLQEAIRLNAKHSTGALAESLSVDMDMRRVIRIESSKEYAAEVDRGSRSRMMWGLINKVVPLKLPGGTTIFRKVSLTSLIRGKWRYPGTQGLDFVEKGAELARARMSGPIGFRIQRTPSVRGLM